MEKVVPWEDSHWCVYDQDNTAWRGGIAFAYNGDRRTREFYMLEYAMHKGQWIGRISYIPSSGCELWQLATNLYEEGDDEELDAHIATEVTPLDDSTFLDRLADYDTGMLDGVAEMCDNGLVSTPGSECIDTGYVDVLSSPYFVRWQGSMPANNEVEARRLMESNIGIILDGHSVV